MKTTAPDMPMSVVTDPLEIASIRRNGTGDIIGWQSIRHEWYAYDHSLELWRARRRKRQKAAARMGGVRKLLNWMRGWFSRESGNG